VKRNCVEVNSRGIKIIRLPRISHQRNQEIIELGLGVEKGYRRFMDYIRELYQDGKRVPKSYIESVMKETAS